MEEQKKPKNIIKMSKKITMNRYLIAELFILREQTQRNEWKKLFQVF